MSYCKMYFSGDQEIFEYDATGIQGYPAERQELPFLESLLSFQELDLDELTPMLRHICDRWGLFFETGNRQNSTDAMAELAALADRHIYFQLLYRSWYDSFSTLYQENSMDRAAELLPIDELRCLPERLVLWQKQVQRFFDRILDVDTAGREPQRQACACYLHDAPRDPELFQFQPIPVSFEPVESGRCSAVLYSVSIADMIDYSLRSCVEREVTVRRCKNCGRYFPQTGRVSAEYCGRPVRPGEQTCREIGAFQQWTIKQKDDPVFKVYRREYKKRFAWIKAGRVSAEDFYAWSVQAREKKKDCDQGNISLEEYQDWLKHS